MPDAGTARAIAAALSVATHIGFPLLMLTWLTLTAAKSRLYLLLLALLVASGVLATAIAGSAWAWFGAGCRFALPFALVAAVAIAGRRRWRRIPWWPERGRALSWMGIGVVGLLALLLVIDCVHDTVAVATARAYDGEPRRMSFPLRGGRFVVANGGANVVTNGHASVRAQRYALDIDALGRGGFRARGIYPDALTAYEVYGAEVIAPCAGHVAAVRDGLPDQAPGARDVVNLAGNHVLLHCAGDTVLLAHLAPGSVAVREGDAIAIGAAIGRVGNSGNTSEPHLHVHAVRGETTEPARVIGTGEPVPLLFADRFLVRYDVVEN